MYAQNCIWYKLCLLFWSGLCTSQLNPREGGPGHAGILLRKKTINSTHPHWRDQFCGSMPHPWGMLNKNTQVPKISTFYFVKINHKNLSSYITNNKTFSSYKNKILDLEKTPFTLLLLNTWRPLWYHGQWKVSELQFSFKSISSLCVLHCSTLEMFIYNEVIVEKV